MVLFGERRYLKYGPTDFIVFLGEEGRGEERKRKRKERKRKMAVF